MNNALLINSTCDLILLLGTAMCCIMVGYEIGSHKKTHIVCGHRRYKDVESTKVTFINVDDLKEESKKK